MIFLKLWWLLLVFCCPGSTWEDTDADQFSGVQEQSVEGSNHRSGSFSGAVEMARPEDQELWPSFEDLDKQETEKEQARETRNTLDDMLASFAQTPVKLSKGKKGERAWQKEADAWYRDLTKSGALKKRSDSKKVRSARRERERAKYVIAHPDKPMEKPRLKYKEWSNEAIIQKHEGTQRPPQAKDGALSNLDVKLKEVQKMLSDQEILEARDRQRAKDMPKTDEVMAENNLADFGDAPVPDGVYERTLNRLASTHPKRNKLNQKSPQFSGTDNTKQKKRSFSTGFNPMDEIKLKTSIRLMRKGFGPLLPSSSLDLSRNHMVDSKELEDLQPQQFDSGQEGLNMKTGYPQDNSFDFSPSNEPALNVEEMMELPKSYDKRVPHYDPLPNVLDYERNNRMPTDLDRFKREPGQDKSSLESSSLEAGGEPALKPSSQKGKIKSLEREEDLKVPELGSDTKEAPALDLAKENDSKDEKLKESREYNKLDGKESKLDLPTSAVEGKGESREESEFEAKLMELAAAGRDSPSKSQVPASLDSSSKEVPKSEAELDIDSKPEEVVAKVENDDDMLKVNIDLKLKEPEAKSVGEEAGKLEAKEAAAVVASNPMSYPDAVVKLMADEMSLYKDRGKRQAQFRRFSQPRRRARRSLGEDLRDYNNLKVSLDNDSLAHVYDPTKNMVPMMNHRPNAVPPAPPQQVQVQQQPQVNRQPVQISDFKASFNLSNLFNEIQKLQNIKPPPQQDKPKQDKPIQQTVTPVTIKPTSAPIKSFGVLRFFGPIFNQLKTSSVSTIDPNCVSITTPDGNATTPEPGLATPQDNVCDSPDSVKVNVSINANVCADPKTKKFYSNGSISLQPNQELPPETIYKTQVSKAYMDKDERQAREIPADVSGNSPHDWDHNAGLKRPPQKDHEGPPGRKQASAKQTAQKVAPKKGPEVARKWNPPETGDSYERLISGQLSKDIVAAVFEAVRNDPELALLLPILERNLKQPKKQPKDHYQVQKDKTESSFLHRQTCIPLRPDLQEFYDLVLRTADEEQKTRQKNQDEVLEKRLAGDGYTPRFVKLMETAENFKESGEH